MTSKRNPPKNTDQTGASAGRKPKAGPSPNLSQPPDDASNVVALDAPPVGAPRPRSFPIVGIGASAGGLAAFEAFFSNLPSNSESGMAFVLVQHLDPGHKSLLTELIQRYTHMRVQEATEGMTVEPNCTYIIPPNKDMALLRGQLHLIEPAMPRGMRLPIDYLFRSLAQDREELAICIVLTGTGTDGTLGLRAIKDAGGMTMVQTPESADYDGMPRSAILTGLADYILPPKDMPAQLNTYVQHAFGKYPWPAAPSPDVANWIHRILILLRSHSGHDFTLYKQSTITRRITRRMVLNQIERIDLYEQFLRKNPAEMDALFRELLIGVTGFFRDPEAFEALQKHIIAALFPAQDSGAMVRVWVPGCSTGEEAYSIAILLQEQADRLRRSCSIQVFATDIDHQAIEKARAGVYPTSIAADVSSERLTRFFIQEDDFYRVKKSIRDLVVFAKQDVIKDPPFSKLDLLSCRNLLIYMDQDLQKKILPLFYYALQPDGFLFLGSSESIGEFTNLFDPLDRKWKLYRRKEGVSYNAIANLVFSHHSTEVLPTSARDEPREKKINLRDLTEKALLKDYAPSSVLVNASGEILFVHGRSGKYLELPAGEINTNITRSAREGLRVELTTALRKVQMHGEPARYERLPVKTNESIQEVNLVVRPASLPFSETGLILVIFEDALPLPSTEPANSPNSDNLRTDKDHHIVALERELIAKEEYLQTTIEELETTNEELKSTNEELQSTNEELQSTNEELDTSKEELQSINEELVTVNTELQQKIDSLSNSNNDMSNLLTGTGVGTVFIDAHLCIQRFTPAATRIINLIQTDIGRPLGHIVSNLQNYNRLVEDTQAVLETLISRETDVQTKSGLWYLMRILPYRTLENVIEGAVITFVEINEQKRLQERLQINEDRLKSVLENVDGVIWAIDAHYRLILASSAFHADQRQIYGRIIQEGETGLPEWMPQEQIKRWKACYTRALQGESFQDEAIFQSLEGQPLYREISFTPIRVQDGRVTGVVCIERDITDRKRQQEADHRLATLLRDADDAILAYDLAGRILAWSPAAERLYGWSEAEALTMNIHALTPEDQRPAVGAHGGAPLHDSASQHTRRIAKDGRVLDVRLATTALLDSAGKPYAIATIERILNPQDF